MSGQPENPAAFPHDEKWGDGAHYLSRPGMTLRDYFAAAALTGMMGNSGLNNQLAEMADQEGVTVEQLIADCCYAHADALLAERAKAGAA